MEEDDFEYGGLLSRMSHSLIIIPSVIKLPIVWPDLSCVLCNLI